MRGKATVLACRNTLLPEFVLTEMNNQAKEQLILWRAAVMALGRTLRREFECDQQDVTDRMRQLLAELENKEKTESGAG